MTVPGAADRHPLCPKCFRPVTAKMPRVLTDGASYHRRCYLGVLHPRPEPVRLPVSLSPANGSAPPRDRLPLVLERLAQIVFVVILIGTALILAERVLP
jgi:hypothetical protein